MLWFNKKNGMLTDINMRKAINAAINNDEMMTAAFSNKDLFTLEPGYMSMDLDNWATEAGKEAYNLGDAEQAKQLLAEAGYNGETITVITSKDYQYYYDAGVVLQQQLKKQASMSSLRTTIGQLIWKS